MIFRSDLEEYNACAHSSVCCDTMPQPNFIPVLFAVYVEG